MKAVKTVGEKLFIPRFTNNQIVSFIPTFSFLKGIRAVRSEKEREAIESQSDKNVFYGQYITDKKGSYLLVPGAYSPIQSDIKIKRIHFSINIKKFLSSISTEESCSICKEVASPKRTIISISGESVCNLCFSELSKCSGCGRIKKNKDLKKIMGVGKRIHDESYYCDSCIKTKLTKCEACQKVVSYRDYVEKRGKKFCAKCSRWFTSTACCGRVLEKTRTKFCRYCTSFVCDEHYRDHKNMCSSQRSISRDSVDLTPVYGTEQGKYLRVNRTVGYEVEAVFEEKITEQEYLKRKRMVETFLPEEYAEVYDRSLSSKVRGGDTINGKEFLTSPKSLNAAEQSITNLCDFLKKSGMVVNKTCGLHVHIGADDIKKDPVKLGHLLRTVYAVEDLLFSVNPPSRWNNNYCVALSKKYSFEDFARPMNSDDFDSRWYATTSRELIKSSIERKRDTGRTRYCGLNLHSTFHNGTIEFRHHAGSLNAEKILGWTGLLLTIVDYAENHYNDQQVIELYRASTTMDKLKLFFTYFSVSEEIKKYMRERVAEFNPRFSLYKQALEEISKKNRKFGKMEVQRAIKQSQEKNDDEDVLREIRSEMAEINSTLIRGIMAKAEMIRMTSGSEADERIDDLLEMYKKINRI